MDEIQGLTPDKSPGPDGVTNRMLRAGGEKFNTIIRADGVCWPRALRRGGRGAPWFGAPTAYKTQKTRRRA